MAMTFEWPMVDQFLDRTGELTRLEEWWESPELMPINLYGRRRAGKSWLFRRFAHGKPAVILVARRTATGVQLSTFAEQLASVLGVEPALSDLAALFRVLFRAARHDKLLVVIDEFPWLLPTTEAHIEAELSTIQAVIEEERDNSHLKLVLCGSLISHMEALQSEGNPLRGRLIPLQLHPLPFEEAALFYRDLDPIGRFERYAISGGMPRYLSALADGVDLRTVVTRQVLDRNAPLINEARTVLEQELREPKMYFAILQALASGDKGLNEITQALRADRGVVSKYLAALQDMRVVDRRLPVDADRDSRSGHWHLLDPFFRFWFRFVFPYQDELENGLGAGDLYDTEVKPALGDHVAAEFEQWCRRWVRTNHGSTATKVGAWWGRSTNDARTNYERQTEEIDVVGIARNRVTVIGEAKWQNRKLDASILRDLDEFKIPALEAGGFKVSPDRRVMLFARSGYSKSLLAAADADPRILLVDVAHELDILQ
jgi:uncharacterized protein